MFKDRTLSDAAVLSAVIAALIFAAGCILCRLHNSYCKKHKDDGKKTQTALTRVIILILFSAAGLYIGNLINIGTIFYIALSHGMTADPDTVKYILTYGEVLTLNKKSIKESDTDINDLKNKAVIFVRYDCSDCIILHEQLAELDDFIFLSSRTENGKKARELYNINLTEVPQGVYIDPKGNATTICITQKTDNSLTLDYDQIDILRKLVREQD